MSKVKKINIDLFNKYQELEKSFLALNIKPEKRKTIESLPPAELKKYSLNVPELIKSERERVLGEDQDSKIQINILPKIVIQNLFDEWFRLSTSQNKKEIDQTFLFRDLNNKKDTHFHAKKVLRSWDVKISVDILLSQEKRDVKAEFAAIDQGGPTRAFVSAFCDQLGDLVIRIPISEDINENGSSVDPDVGSRVFKPKPFGEGTITGKTEDKQFLVDFDDLDSDSTPLSREDFNVKEIAISLFDCSGSSSLVPQRDLFFQTEFERKIRDYDSEFDLDRVLKKAKTYYRAVGRFMAHVIFDDQAKLSTVVLPEMLRNLLLRNEPPETQMYSISDLALDLHNIDINFSKKRQISMKTENLEFTDYLLDDDL